MERWRASAVRAPAATDSASRGDDKAVEKQEGYKADTEHMGLWACHRERMASAETRGKRRNVRTISGSKH
eukprot:2000749-Pleurochrysis_carterae.AAC.1